MAKVELPGFSIPKPTENRWNKPDKCIGCPAWDEPGPVWGSGSDDPDYIIVGEAPGETEIEKGEGFVGQSGGLLWYMGSKVGVERARAYISNTAKCKTKHPGAFMHCARQFLLPEMSKFPDHIPIIALGDEAKKVLAPQIAHIPITIARGTMEGRVMVALHPAYIRRTITQSKQESEEKQDLTPTLAMDMAEARNYAGYQVVKDYALGIIDRIPTDVPFVSCDLETDNRLDPRHGPIDQIGFAWAPGKVMREKYSEDRRELYQKILRSHRVVFHNMVFDLDWLEYNGYEIPEKEDTMLGAHLLTPDFPLGLEFQNSLYVHYSPWKSLKRRDPHSYHAKDLDTTWQMWDRMVPELRGKGLWPLYLEEVKPATLVCLRMKQRGIRIDQNKMIKLNIALLLQVQKIDGALNKFANIDWNSNQQIASLFYDRLNLPVQTNRKTQNRTVDADALETIVASTGHPIPKLVLQRRKIEKMRTTYTDYNLDSEGRFHGDVSFTAATGRARGFLLTLQRGPMRSLFLPSQEGWEMAYADWNRVELWIAAIVSGDKKFQEILENYNFHMYVGSRAFGKEITKKDPEYHETKFITHGLNYGRGEKSIAIAHEIPVERVRKIVNWMHSEFPRWAEWRQSQLKKAMTYGELTNVFGFTRYFWSGNIKGMAWAFTPQSVPAHMIKRCLPQLESQLPKPADLLLPYHDAVLVSYPVELRTQVFECLHDVMEQAWPELDGWKAQITIGTGVNFQEASED